MNQNIKCLAVISCLAFMLLSFINCKSSPVIFTPSGALKKPTLPSVSKTVETTQTLSPARISALKEQLVSEFSLQLLITLARATNPEIIKAIAKTHVAEGELMQAGIAPNPMLKIYVEDIPINDNRSIHWTDIGFRLFQEISISGNLGVAELKAKANKTAKVWDLVAAEHKLDIICAAAFFGYRAQTLKKSDADEIANNRTKQFDVVSKEVESGKSSNAKLLKYLKLKTQADIQAQNALRNVEISRNQLKALLSDFDLTFGKPTFTNELDYNVFKEFDKTKWLADHPTYQAAIQKINVAEADVEYSKSKHLKNMRFGFGYDYEGELEESWLGFEFEVPLPLWNAGRGNVLKAQANIVIARQEAAKIAAKLFAQLFDAKIAFESSKNQLEALNVLIDAQNESLNEIKKGLSSVSTQFDVLDAECELLKLQMQKQDLEADLLTNYYFLHITTLKSLPTD